MQNLKLLNKRKWFSPHKHSILCLVRAAIIYIFVSTLDHVTSCVTTEPQNVLLSFSSLFWFSQCCFRWALINILQLKGLIFHLGVDGHQKLSICGTFIHQVDTNTVLPQMNISICIRSYYLIDHIISFKHLLFTPYSIYAPL